MIGWRDHRIHSKRVGGPSFPEFVHHTASDRYIGVLSDIDDARAILSDFVRTQIEKNGLAVG